MNIMGIDLGTVKAAYTLITDDASAPKFDSTLLEVSEKLPVSERFTAIITQITDKIAQVQPELVVVEYPFNIKGNASVLIEVYGAVRYFCLKNSFAFLGMPQTKIKKYATGSGGAEKSDMRMQLYKEFGLDFSEDRTDSFWIAHMGMTYLYGSDKKHRQESIDAMKKVKEPKKKKGKVKNNA